MHTEPKKKKSKEKKFFDRWWNRTGYPWALKFRGIFEVSRAVTGEHDPLTKFFSDTFLVLIVGFVHTKWHDATYNSGDSFNLELYLKKLFFDPAQTGNR